MSPSLSLIIPTLNRAALLEKTLKSILQQDSAQLDFEVIVVDNGSTDDTKKVCLKCQHLIKNFQYVYSDEPGLLTGRHLGAEIATGQVLCFLDDDVQLNPNYVKGAISLFKNEQVEIATGPCLPNYEIEPPEWLNYFWTHVPEGKYCAWLSLLDFGSETKEIMPGYVWGLNFCIRKKTLIALGGFHPDCIPSELQQYQGDGETGLTDKAAASEMNAFYSPQLMLQHAVPKARLTIEYFKKRAYYAGVCNSFTTLRKQQQNIETKTPFSKRLRDKLHRYYRKIKGSKKHNPITLPDHINELIDELAKSENDGYNFHQYNFKNSVKVKEWVLKQNYWDYKLPL